MKNLFYSNGKNRVTVIVVIAFMLLSIPACTNNRKNSDRTLSSLGSRVLDFKPKNDRNKQLIKEISGLSIVEFENPNQKQTVTLRAEKRYSNIAMESSGDKILTPAERREQAEKLKGSSDAGMTSEEDVKIDYAAVARQYEALLKDRQIPVKTENVLYQLARAYDFSGQLNNSLDSLTRLIEQHPYTKRRDEIQFRRGELLFQLNRFGRAEEAYATVLASYGSPFYERSLYKHAWAIYKQSHFRRALKSFYQLLDSKFKGDKGMKDFSSSERSTIVDTFRVVSQIHSSLNGFESIRDYSSSVGRRSYEYQLFARLSKQYLDQERYNDAAKTLSAFVEWYPNHANSPLVLLKVIDIYEKGGFREALIKAKINFVNRYGLANNYWTLQEPSLLVKVSPKIKKNLVDLAKHFHSLGQKRKREVDYAVSAKWYREYVTSFPSEPNTVTMNFLLAENLSDSNNYQQAIIEYENTAYNYGKHKKAAEAAYAAILNYQTQIALLSGDTQLKQRKKAAASSIRFAEFFPKDKRTPAVLLKTAEEYLDFKKMELATLTANKIVNYKTKESIKLEKAAFAIIGAAEFSLGHHRKAELISSQQLRSMSANAKNRNTYMERLAASVYKQGEAARDSGNLALAASHFLRLSTLAPNSIIRVTAEYDGAIALMNMGDIIRSVQILEKILAAFPNHKLANKAVAQLANSYEKQKKWSLAADMYSKVIKHESNREKKRELNWHMAELFAKSGNTEKAISYYVAYIKKYNKPFKQSMEARQLVADFYSKLQNKEQRKRWLKNIIEANKRGDSTERSTFLAATAALELAEPIYRLYHNVELVKPLQKNLKKKKKLLQQSVQVYTEAANYDVAEITTAATYRIAEIYNEFSKGLFGSERPSGLSPEELEQYDILIEEQAYPFEEKAIDVHESNALRIRSGIYNKWVQHSLQSLKSLQPVRYNKDERSEISIAEYR